MVCSPFRQFNLQSSTLSLKIKWTEWNAENEPMIGK